MGIFTKKQRRNENEIDVDKEKLTTTRIISITLLFTFVGTIIILFVANIFFSKSTTGAPEESWFDLLKNSIIGLSASFTTILGYYFGQRGVEKVEQKLVQREEDITKKDTMLQSAYQGAETVMQEIKEITKTIKKSDPENPDINSLPKKKK